MKLSIKFCKKINDYITTVVSVKGVMLLEFAILLAVVVGCAAFMDFDVPMGNFGEKTVNTVNIDAYKFGGVPKPKDKKEVALEDFPKIEHEAPGSPVINITVDEIETDFNFVVTPGKTWSPTAPEMETLTDRNNRFASVSTLLTFGKDALGTYRFFFNDEPGADSTKKENGIIKLMYDKRDYAPLEIQIIVYTPNANRDGYTTKILESYNYNVTLRDIELNIQEPCKIALNFRGSTSSIGGQINKDLKSFLDAFFSMKRLS